MSILHLLLLLLLLLATPAARAGASAVVPDRTRWLTHADAIWRHVADAQGQAARTLAQDASGFLWLGSESGLMRWDGYRLRAHHADPTDATALPDNFIVVLHTDPAGRLWIGTAAGGLARHEPVTDAFVSYRAGPAGLSGATVSAIADDGAGGLWIGTDVGLDHLDPATGVVRRVALDSPRGAVMAVLQDSNGSLWVGTERGLARRAPGSASFRAFPVDGLAPGLPYVSQLKRDSAGHLWIGTLANGAFVVEPGKQQARAVRESSGTARLEGEQIRSIAETAPGEIWLGTYGGGIVRVDIADGWRTRRLRHHAALPSSLRDDDISVLFVDRGGLLWAGSALALSRHDPRQLTVTTLFGDAGGGRAIGSPNITAVLAAEDGRVWLGLGGGGIEILDPAGGPAAALRADPARPVDALPRGRVLAMATAPDGAVWIGTRNGLYRADAQGRGVRRVNVPQRAADAAVWAMCFHGSLLWLGDLDGLWGLDTSRPAAPLLRRRETAERLGNPRVTALLLGADGALWVGTRSGLTRIDGASGVAERLPTDTNDPTSLRSGYVTSLLNDRQGRLWVGTAGRGLQVLERRDAAHRARFRHLGVREGLPQESTNMMLLDAAGQVWVSTDGGLAVIDPATFEVRSLGALQGVAIRGYWSSSGARTSAGDLLFGGLGGLTVVQPGAATRSRAPPPVVVTEVRAGGRSLVPGSLSGTAPGPPAIPQAPLMLPAAEQSLLVEFSALDFAAPEHNRYSYRLVGFDADWITSEPSRRLAAYTNLPPGDYTLQLRGGGPSASVAQTLLELPVRVLPRWYQSAWFHAAAGLALLGGLAATLQLRTRYLRRRQQELLSLVALRTAELEQQGSALRDSQRQLEQIAYCDPLTGLANRRRFNEDLAQLLALSARGGASVALLLIDLDRFKEVNDRLGHDAGDALLIAVAQRLTAMVRQGDRVARLGGDEFAVLLADSASPGVVETSCSRIVQALALPMDHRGQSLQASVSIGAARCPGDAVDGDALYKCADLALYEAKRAGRNAWRWFAAEPGKPERDAQGCGSAAA